MIKMIGLLVMSVCIVSCQAWEWPVQNDASASDITTALNKFAHQDYNMEIQCAVRSNNIHKMLNVVESRAPGVPNAIDWQNLQNTMDDTPPFITYQGFTTSTCTSTNGNIPYRVTLICFVSPMNAPANAPCVNNQGFIYNQQSAPFYTPFWAKCFIPPGGMGSVSMEFYSDDACSSPMVIDGLKPTPYSYGLATCTPTNTSNPNTLSEFQSFVAVYSSANTHLASFGAIAFSILALSTLWQLAPF